MTNELDAGRAIEILEDDELEQENAAMGEQMDAERAAFEAAFEGVFFSSCFEREDDGSYAGRGLQGAWLGWQKARASLPVGVPDESMVEMAAAAYDRAANAGATHEQAWHEALSVALTAAPTVKAEQVPVAAIRKLLSNWDDLKPGDSENVDAVRKWLTGKAPSLPAASDLTASQCACGDEYPANSYGAGFMAANNGICENCDAANSCASEPMPAAGSSGKYADVLRPFFAMMEAELHANAGKGDRPGWLEMTAEQCMLEIYYHAAKLQKAVKKNDMQGVREYSADVANMSMMLADICGWLDIVSAELSAKGADQ